MFKGMRERQEREKEAAKRAQEIMDRASRKGYVDDGAGYGKLTKAQKKSLGG